MPDCTDFFNFLHTSVHTCAWMTDKSVVQGYGCIFIEGVVEAPTCEPSACLHTTLNNTNLQGRKTKDIVSCRVLCVDIDRTVTVEELETIKHVFQPHMIVESSWGRYHLYWKISPVIPLDRWRQFQLGLAWRLDSDKHLANVTAMIRVPGFERTCKDGLLFTPSIIWQVSEVQELTEKGVLAAFKDDKGSILDWAEKGEEALNAERQAAKALWKDKGGDFEYALAQMPNAGRNTTLYIALKDALYKRLASGKAVSSESGLKLAYKLNERFPTPLDNWEVEKLCGSVLRKLGDYKDREREKRKEAVDALTVYSISEALAIADNLEIPVKEVVVPENKHITIRTDAFVGDAFVGDAFVGESFPELPGAGSSVPKFPGAGNFGISEGKNDNGNGHHPESISSPPVILPKSIGLAGDRFGQLLWEHHGESCHKQLASALKLRNYTGIANFLCSHWHLIGAFKKDGPIIFLAGQSKWGAAINKSVNVDRDNFALVINNAVVSFVASLLLGQIDKGSKSSKGGGVKGGQGKNTVKRMPTHSTITNIARACWAAACGWKPIRRQNEDIIVFQNGVLDLRTETFIENHLAPMLYSHPLWCHFDVRAYKALAESSSLCDILPMFSKYIADWFPDDAGIIKSLLRMAGYCFTTDTRQQKFMFFHGPTRAGKGSICRTICSIVGDENYESADYSVLDGNFRTAGIYDKLIISIEEAEGTDREHEKRINYLKKLLGGEKITFERKYQQPFNDNVCGKFIFQSNDEPRFPDKGHAVQARLVVVGFEKSFRDSPGVDPTMEILKSEANALATLAAISWCRARQQMKPFELSESRALEIGKARISHHLDIVSATLERFFEYKGEEECTTQVMMEAVGLAADIDGGYIKGRLNIKIKDETDALFPEVVSSKNILVGGRRHRGYKHLFFNIEKFIEHYPEVEDSLIEYQYKYPLLCQQLNAAMNPPAAQLLV